MSDAATISRGARWFVLAGAGFLVLCTLAAAFDLPRGTVVALGLHGFVFHTVFGKAYSLVPTYFDRSLAASRAPMIHVPLAAVGAVGLAVPSSWTIYESSPVAPDVAGALLWSAGAALFLGTVVWTVRDNLAGRETATAASKADRARLDRIANGVMPVALGFLALGAYETAALGLEAPSLTESSLATAHVLAVGTAALFVFSIGARLLPRFLRASAPTWLVVAVLATGVTGPLLLAGWFAAPSVDAVDLPETGLLHGAVVLLSVAVLGHAAVVGVLRYRAPAPRIGAYGVVLGAVGGVATVAAGALVGLGDVPELLAVHPRLGLLGFLGLTIVGVAYHFYPPAIVGDSGDRVAAASIALLASGLAVETASVLADSSGGVSLGQYLAVTGALAYTGLLAASFRARANRH